MPRSSSERTHARRPFIEDIKKDRGSWLRHGVAALAVSLLGLGVAGSVVLTGAAQHTTWTATVATDQLTNKTSRGTERARLDPAKVKSLADQRAEELSKIDSEVSEASMAKSAKARAKALEAVSDATRRQAVLLARGQARRSDPQLAQADANGSGRRGCLPVTSGYRIAASFGQTGPWSRYLLVPCRNPSARSCRWSGDQRGNRVSQRVGRQLCRDQARGWHPHTIGSYVIGFRQCWPDCVGVPDRRQHWADRKDLRRPRPSRGLSGWRETWRRLQRNQSSPLAQRPRRASLDPLYGARAFPTVRTAGTAA